MNENEINKKIHVEIIGEKCWHDIQKGCVVAASPSGRLITSPRCQVCHKTNARNPNYCQNISDAFLVVEELEKQGFQWTFNRTNPIKSFHDNLPYARFWQYEKGKIVRTGWSEAKSLSESICLAALKTLENEK